MHWDKCIKSRFDPYALPFTAAALGGLGGGLGAAVGQYAQPLGGAAADAWDGVAGSTVACGLGLAVSAGQANARAESWTSYAPAGAY